MTTAPAPWLFVVGCGRSGTTLLAAMLDSHPQLAIPGESGFILPLLRSRLTRLGPEALPGEFAAAVSRFERFGAWGIDEPTLRAYLYEKRPSTVEDALRLTYGLYASSVEKPAYGDKTPDHVLDITAIAEHFPEAVFAHVIRDGRDVALSTLAAPWGPVTVEGAAVYWRMRVEAGRRAGRRLPRNRYVETLYEDLIADPERELGRILALIGLDFDSRMLLHAEAAARQIAMSPDPSADASLARPRTQGLRDWRRDMSPSDVLAFEQLARRTLRRSGYPTARRVVATGLGGSLATAARILRGRKVESRAKLGRLIRRFVPRRAEP